MRMNWTESKIDRLKKLHAAGFSAELIGERLGVSRNAVIGKWNRLNLGTHVVFHAKDGRRWNGRHGFTATIIELCKSDSTMTMREIAAHVGCSYTHVAKVIEANELPKRPRRIRADSAAKLGLAARKAGLTLDDIRSFKK